jgi:hypothetical protein
MLTEAPTYGVRNNISSPPRPLFRRRNAIQAIDTKYLPANLLLL